MKNLNLKNLIKFMTVIVIVAMTYIVLPVYADENIKNNKENFRVNAVGSLFNLAFGGIVKDSEFVYLNGILLDKSKSQYTIDYGAAILTVNTKMKIGDFVDVDYCYVPNTAKISPINAVNTGLSQLKFSNGNSMTNMSFLYNAIDATNGNSVYGTNFKTTLSNNLFVDSNIYKSVGEGGAGDFNLHNLSYKNNGFDLSLGYQDSSQDFNGMNYVVGQGNIDQSSASEIGLKRVNFGLNYSFKNNGKFSVAYNTVGDDNDTIKKTNISYDNSKLNFSYNTQNIGSEFVDFNKLKDTDKVILNQEKGVNRKDISFGYDFGIKGGKLNFTQNGIDYNDSNIIARNLSYDIGKFKYNYYNRNIDSDFINFNNLKNTDKEQMVLEKGINRTVHDLSFDIGKANAANIQSYSSLALETENGKKLDSNSLKLNFNNFEGQYFSLNSDSDFSGMNALNYNEKNNFSAYARKFFNYNHGVKNVNDTDRNSWANQCGINRKMSFLKYGFTPDTFMTYNTSALSLDNGAELNSSRLNLLGKYKGQNVNFFYYKDNIDKDFKKLSKLTDVEKDNYRNMYGMNRTNYGFDGTFSLGYFKYTDDSINDTISDSLFKRQFFNYVVPKYNLSFIDTKIDDSFNRINDISDSNRATYNEWKGYDRKEYIANMKFGSSSKVFDVNTYFMDQSHENLDSNYKQNTITVNYIPDAKFNASYYTNNYTYENNDIYNINNKETIVKMNKMFGLGKLANNSFNACYRTNSYLNGTDTINQKFIDLSYKTDSNAKFAFNLDYNTSEYSEMDKRKSFDFYATQKVTDKIGLTFGYGQTNFMQSDPEKRIKYGVVYSVNDSFSFAYNVDKITKGNEDSKDGSSLMIQGKLPKLFNENFISNLVADYKHDFNKTIDITQNYNNNNYGISANILKGSFAIQKSSILDETSKSWYNDTEKISYKNDSLFGSKLSVEFAKNSTTNAVSHKVGDVTVYKFNYSLGENTSTSYKLTKGGWSSNQPIDVKSEEFSLSQKIIADNSISIKYIQNINPANSKDENIWSLAFDNKASQKKGKFSISAGISSIYKANIGRDNKLTYSLEYEYMLSKERFLSVIASKSTDINIDDSKNYVTDTVSFDYRHSF